MDQPTTCISRHGVSQIANAFAFSEYENIPLTAFVTVVWKRTSEWSDDQLHDRHGQLFHRLARWCRKNDLSLAYIWTVENSPENGLHTHIAVHVPKGDFDRLTAEFPGLVPGHWGDPLAVRFSADRWSDPPKFFAVTRQRAGHLRYMLKGLDRDAAFNVAGKRLSFANAVGIRPGKNPNEGVVSGKRYGVSQSIGSAARQRTGYVDETAPDQLFAILNPAENWWSAAA